MNLSGPHKSRGLSVRGLSLRPRPGQESWEGRADPSDSLGGHYDCALLVKSAITQDFVDYLVQFLIGIDIDCTRWLIAFAIEL